MSPGDRRLGGKSAPVAGELMGGFSARVDASAFSDHDRLRRLEEYVLRRYGEPISATRAARLAGLDAKYFSTFFHQRTGVRFRDWLAMIRVSQAIRRMAAGNQSITRIASEVGFRDLRTIERAFKRLTGKTPSQVKKSLRP